MSKTIKCFVCDLQFCNNDSFLRHIELVHSSLKIFRCTESNCGRSYSILNSYKEHRKTKHALQEVDKLVANIMIEELQLTCELPDTNTEALSESSIDNVLTDINCSDDDRTDSEEEELISKPINFIEIDSKSCTDSSLSDIEKGLVIFLLRNYISILIFHETGLTKLLKIRLNC